MSEYLSMGDTGSEAGVNWNSTKVPGTCKPSDFTTLAKFKALQEQVNRVLHMKGLAKIAVDGDFGGGTVAAFNRAMGASVGSCAALAGSVTSYTTAVKAAANLLGAPAKVSGPAPITPPSIVNATGNLVVAPPGAGTAVGASLLDSFRNAGTPALVAGAGIAAGLAYLLIFSKPKGGGGAKGSAGGGAKRGPRLGN